MKNKKEKIIVLIILSAYAAIMIYLMFFGFGRRTSNEYRYNFVPFKEIIELFRFYIRFGATRDLIINIFGNIGMFVPFGILLTVLFDFKFIKPLIIFVTGVILLETTQLVSRRGVFDIDDIILNTIGFLTGYAIITIINKLIKKFRRRSQNEKTQNIC